MPRTNQQNPALTANNGDNDLLYKVLICAYIEESYRKTRYPRYYSLNAVWRTRGVMSENSEFAYAIIAGGILWLNVVAVKNFT